MDLAYVAAGRMDGFWEFGLKPWDTAAGVLLIQEAGGRVGTPTGAAICCPVAGQPVTVDACRSQSGFDTGGSTDAGADATSDAAIDSGKADAKTHD